MGYNGEGRPTSTEKAKIFHADIRFLLGETPARLFSCSGMRTDSARPASLPVINQPFLKVHQFSGARTHRISVRYFFR